MIKLGIDTSSGDRTDKTGQPIDITGKWVNAATNQLRPKPDLEALLVGESGGIDQGLEMFCSSDISSRVRVKTTDSYHNMRGVIIGDKDKTSYRILLNELRSGAVDGVISGGNTKVLVTELFRRDRLNFYKSIPPLTIEIPTMKGHRALLLDIGATNKHDADLLVHFAKIGLAYMRGILGRPNPRIGLLSNGTEPDKGNYFIQEAADKLRKTFGEDVFVGQIDPKDEYSPFAGNIDIFLAPDGVTGNLVLKITESTVKFFEYTLKYAIKRTDIPFYKRWARKVGAGLLKYGGAFDDVKSIMDPSNYNGTPFLGFNYSVFKSHGESDIQSMEAAIANAYEFLKADKFRRFNEELKRVYGK